jgi:hypothetical protein
LLSPPIETSAPPKNGDGPIVGDLLPPVAIQPTEKTAQALFNPHISAINSSTIQSMH